MSSLVGGAASVHTGIGGMEMVGFRPMTHSSCTDSRIQEWINNS